MGEVLWQNSVDSSNVPMLPLMTVLHYFDMAFSGDQEQVHVCERRHNVT
jgi:hypothetical protein